MSFLARSNPPPFPRRRAPQKGALTNLYNEHPAWLDNTHRDLDRAVAAAYGWPADITEEDALACLLAINLARSR